MRFRSLDITLDDRLVGVLFQYGQGAGAITRLQPEPAYWLDRQAPPVLSWAARFADAADRAAFVHQHTAQPFFNGVGERLPAFFQNLLPEGPLRRHLEQLRGCAPDDHFDILAMCGDDLPGAVRATPSAQSRQATAAIVTQHQDALEPSVVDDPVAGAVSLSGIQPKLGLVEKGGRYVARTRARPDGVHIIAKLPAADYALLPEVEALSLQLAHAAGVRVCAASLRPVSDIEGQDQPFTLHAGANFLAVQRFDRDGARHIHCEDFAQVLGLDPLDKYRDPRQRANYAALLLTLRESMGLGDEAAHELLRRLMVNEMLGNYDAHVKNFGVVYADGRTPALSPAYDVVAYAAYLGGRGHALKFFPGAPERAQLTPALVRQLCNAAGLLETRVRAVLRETVARALETWPALIEASELLPEQKARLQAHFHAVPAVQTLARRGHRARAAA